jgi:uncharacterized protein YuzE
MSLTIRYDKIGDILYIDKVMPYREQDSEQLEDEIVARFNPNTNEVENLEILWFLKRLQAGEDVVLPLDAHLRLAVEA